MLALDGQELKIEVEKGSDNNIKESEMSRNQLSDYLVEQVNEMLRNQLSDGLLIVNVKNPDDEFFQFIKSIETKTHVGDSCSNSAAT